jgi:hypothetical protein
MDYFQGVVTENLRADRAMFVNTECCIQLNPGANPDRTGPHWFCDAVAVNLRDEAVFLMRYLLQDSRRTQQTPRELGVVLELVALGSR